VPSRRVAGATRLSCAPAGAALPCASADAPPFAHAAGAAILAEGTAVVFRRAAPGAGPRRTAEQIGGAVATWTRAALAGRRERTADARVARAVQALGSIHAASSARPA